MTTTVSMENNNHGSSSPLVWDQEGLNEIATEKIPPFVEELKPMIREALESTATAVITIAVPVVGLAVKAAVTTYAPAIAPVVNPMVNMSTAIVASGPTVLAPSFDTSTDKTAEVSKDVLISGAHKGIESVGASLNNIRSLG